MFHNLLWLHFLSLFACEAALQHLQPLPYVASKTGTAFHQANSLRNPPALGIKTLLCPLFLCLSDWCHLLCDQQQLSEYALS